MHTITANNVNGALAAGLRLLFQVGVERPSRNGPVLRSPMPVATTYLRPMERVLFSPLRDANPFFHFMESLWMLAGRDDVAFPAYFNSGMRQYSDNGVSFWGAYGRRWRSWFGYDQLALIADELRRDPDTRRCVLQMWDANSKLPELYGTIPEPHQFASDLHVARHGKDVPCNTQAYFEVQDGNLNMTVCCRSNDIWWGAYGANAVHYSMLQEYMAWRAGYRVGWYTQFSNNYHLYTSVLSHGSMLGASEDSAEHDHYNGGAFGEPDLDFVPASPLSEFNWETSGEDWHWDLKAFFECFDGSGFETLQMLPFKTNFFARTVRPMATAYAVRKNKVGTGEIEAACIGARDWRLACTQWIQRRELAKAAKP